MRSISDMQGKTLKGATLRSLTAGGGGGIVQHSTRISEAQLSKCASGHQDNERTFIAIDVAVEIDILAGSPIIVGAMAEMMGYQLVPMEAQSAVRPISLKDALRIANEAADVVRAITAALEDEHIDALEKREITREGDKAIKALQCVLRRVGASA